MGTETKEEGVVSRGVINSAPNRWLWLVGLVALVSLAFIAGYFVGRSKTDTTVVGILTPTTKGNVTELYPAREHVIGIVVGLTREQDRLLFADFIRDRLVHLCGESVGRFRFSTNHARSGDRFFWDVVLTYDGWEKANLPDCTGFTRLAGVDSATGAMTGIDPSPGAGSWLAQFERGEKP